MARSDQGMAYPVAMRNFVATTGDATGPQLLGLHREGVWHPFRLLVATDERYPALARPSVRSAGHRHAVFHAVLYTAGGNACEIGGQRLQVSAGDLILTSPGEEHRFGQVAMEAFAYRSFTFSLGVAGGEAVVPWSRYLSELLGRDVGEAPRPLRLSGRDLRQAERQISDLHALALATTAEGWWEVHAQVLDFFRLLARVLGTTPGAPVRDVLDEAQAEIRRRWAEPLTVAELAVQAGCSPGRFHRRFRHRFGCSPIAWQLGLRLRAASILLTTTSLPVKAIAERVGFSDQFQFSRAFRRHQGCPPSAFRQATSEAPRLDHFAGRG